MTGDVDAGGTLPSGVQPFDLGRDTLPALLEFSPPPFVEPDKAFAQLTALTEHAKRLGASAFLREQQYIDRDHIEDHSVFYAKSLFPYPNYCQRITFFRGLNAVGLARELMALVRQVNGAPSTYDEACTRFSQKHLVGFVVIRPLPGSRVGRTVFPPVDGDVACAPETSIHLLGLRLAVRGVPFQQQDVAVSACATTALWSSLQAAAEHEPIPWATPAQITRLASEYSLPHGRPMPSDGLSTGQMCQAMHALGVAPSLLRAEDFEDARGCIYSALKSGIAPVLILEPLAGGRDSHAVCATGMRLDRSRSYKLDRIDHAGDTAAQIARLLIHDDRRAPYVECELQRPNATQPALFVPGDPDSPWRLSQIIVPTHPKIRLSFLVLRRLALRLVADSYEAAMHAGARLDSLLVFDLWVQRGYQYVESALLRSRPERLQDVLRLSHDVPLPRYVAVVRLTGLLEGHMDVLLDTTATEKNLHVVAIVRSRADDEVALAIGARLVEVAALPADRSVST